MPPPPQRWWGSHPQTVALRPRLDTDRDQRPPHWAYRRATAGVELIPGEPSRPVLQQASSSWVAAGLDQVQGKDGRDHRDHRGGRGPTAATSVCPRPRKRRPVVDVGCWVEISTVLGMGAPDQPPRRPLNGLIRA